MKITVPVQCEIYNCELESSYRECTMCLFELLPIHLSQIVAILRRSGGKTGVKLPILGYGSAALPKVWSNPLSTEDRIKLVRYSYDRGVRYYDTAGNYMEIQLILGQVLKDFNSLLSHSLHITSPWLCKIL